MKPTIDMDTLISDIRKSSDCLRRDIDMILDSINQINEIFRKNKYVPEDVKKSLDNSMAGFKKLFLDYSAHLNMNEETLKRAEELRVQANSMDDERGL